MPTFSEVVGFDPVTAWARLTPDQQQAIGELAVRLAVVGNRLNYEHDFTGDEQREIERLEHAAVQSLLRRHRTALGGPIRLEGAMIRSQAIKLIGVEDRFTETGHVVVEVGGAYPEVVMFNGDPFIAAGERPPLPDPTIPLEYRKVRPFRFVRKALP